MIKKIVFNSLLGIVLILIWAQFVNVPEIFSTLSKVHITYLIPVFLCLFLSPAIRAWRLKIFLSEIKKIPLKDLILLNGVAQILNFFIPIRAGEIAKGVYLNTNYGLKMSKSITWIFLDRFVDFLVVLALCAVLLEVVPTALSVSVIKIIIVMLTIAVVLTYIAIFKKESSRKIVSLLKILLIEKHLKSYFEKFALFILDAFSILDRHPKDLGLMIVITILGYGADAGVWYFTFKSLMVNQEFLKMYLAQLLSALTYLVPAAPGYVGSAEASGLLILSGIFGIGVNLASAMTVLFHILSAIFVIMFGLISMFTLKIDLGVILKKALRKGN